MTLNTSATCLLITDELRFFRRAHSYFLPEYSKGLTRSKLPRGVNLYLLLFLVNCESHLDVCGACKKLWIRSARRLICVGQILFFFLDVFIFCWLLHARSFPQTVGSTHQLVTFHEIFCYTGHYIWSVHCFVRCILHWILRRYCNDLLVDGGHDSSFNCSVCRTP